MRMTRKINDMANNTTPKKQTQNPPMPAVMFKIMNPLMTLLLSSPFHNAVSKHLMLLTFTGLKSSKKFTTPVGYLQQGKKITLFTHSTWWKNVIGGAAVTMRLRGEKVNGIADVITDPQEILAIVRDLTENRGEEYVRRMGFWLDDPHASPQEILKMVSGTTFIQIELGDI